MNRFAINGKFLSREMNGQIRVAVETVRELDKIVKPHSVVIVAPISGYGIDGLSNIEIIRIGKGNAHIWEQTSYYWYLRNNHVIGINLLNTHPILRPDICYIHDVLFKAHPNLYRGFYGEIQKWYTLLMYKTATRNARAIITVSDFSKREILKYYRVPEEKITVIYNAWQHMIPIKEDGVVIKKLDLVDKDFFLAVGGLTPQKNFQWVLGNARYNPKQIYVIVGGQEGASEEMGEIPENVIFAGRVSDSEIKALMTHCKVFIHPAIYEGFGMTPLEALSVGSNAIVARTACLPEIYSDYVHYIDPNNHRVKLDELMNREYNRDRRTLLERYDWKTTARKLYDLMVSV